jgi:hypothetical protein
VRNEELLHGVKEERNILHTIKRWISQMLLSNCLLKLIIERKVEGGIGVKER